MAKEQKEVKIKCRAGVTIRAKQAGKYLTVPHAELESVAGKLGVMLDYRQPYISDSHCVVVCTASLNGRTVSAVGESTPETLFRESDKNYPVTLAWDRAGDWAIIKLLDPEERVIPEREFPVKAKKASAPAAPEQGPGHQEEPRIIDSHAGVVAETPEPPAEHVVTRDDPILFGQYEGRTFREVENEPDFRAFVAWLRTSNATFTDESKQKQIAFAVRTYC